VSHRVAATLACLGAILATGCAGEKPVQPPRRDPDPALVGEVVVVPAGEFPMGCDDPADAACASSEGPRRTVSVSRFAIDRTEVTVRAWLACESAGACPRAVSVGSCNAGTSGREDYPINCVTWDQARTYCEWVGRRLPTEAEWEKAAAGSEGRRYPWGSEEPDAGGTWRANYGPGLSSVLWLRDHWQYDAPVGRFPNGASPFGALDMAGNVAEWVSDWWADRYDPADTRNPKGPAAGTVRVVRGGSFREFAKRIRTSARDRHEPERWFDFVGFRCAISL
jgi:formylglycine-generating enzyme required for sulfatase activity